MDAATIVTAIANVINLAVQLGPSVLSVEKTAQTIYDNLISGTAITQAQLDALQASIDAAAAEIQAPLPADDGTTTT